MSTTMQQADELYSKTCDECVLVAFASKHGATRDIAGSIAVQLRMDDLDVDLLDVADVKTVEGYSGVILGSAVYMGKLLPEVRAFVTRLESDLKRLPVWLFSSGPVGEDLMPHGEASEVEEIATLLRARGHTVFAGKLDKHNLGLAERLAVNLVRAPEGDFRDWSAIESWTRGIAHELTTEAHVTDVSRT
jgi:menaquinone-dependent protoporphyrinogen oxidase